MSPLALLRALTDMDQDSKGIITFYDLPSVKEKKAWSFNTWKIRSASSELLRACRPMKVL